MFFLCMSVAHNHSLQQKVVIITQRLVNVAIWGQEAPQCRRTFVSTLTLLHFSDAYFQVFYVHRLDDYHSVRNNAVVLALKHYTLWGNSVCS